MRINICRLGTGETKMVALPVDICSLVVVDTELRGNTGMTDHVHKRTPFFGVQGLTDYTIHVYLIRHMILTKAHR